MKFSFKFVIFKLFFVNFEEEVPPSQIYTLNINNILNVSAIDQICHILTISGASNSEPCRGPNTQRQLTIKTHGMGPGIWGLSRG